MKHQRFLFVPVVVGLVIAPDCQAQEAQVAATQAFDVASIKLNAKCDRGGLNDISPGRLELPCMSLRALIQIAYGNIIVGGTFNPRRLEVLGGPKWIDTDRYDISAKVEGRASLAQVLGPMLQTLLEERFKVKAHKESKDTDVYALTVTKANRNLKPSDEGSCTPLDLNNLPKAAPQGGPARKVCGLGGGRLGKGGLMIEDWYGVTMAEFVGKALSNEVDRPVVDRTELAGRFDVHLEFVHAIAEAGSARVNEGEGPTGPSIFTALTEQLGLKLSRATSPVDVIVIDHAEKLIEN